MAKKFKKNERKYDDWYDDEEVDFNKKDKYRDMTRRRNRKMKSAINSNDIETLMRIEDEY